MTNPWLLVAVYLPLAFSTGLMMLLAARALGVRAKASPKTKTLTYECGEEPQGSAWLRFHPRYYVVALIFILFDVETAFLIPWAVTTRSLGPFALVEMVLFAAILLFAWIYALRKGALTWQ